MALGNDLSPQKKLLAIILAFLAFGIISTLVLHHLYGDLFYVITVPCLIVFAIGGLFGYLELYPHPKIKSIIKLSFPFAIIFFIITRFGFTFTLIKVINSVIAINLIMYVIAERYNLVTAFIFENRFLITIGKISYGIYLYHFITPTYYLQFIDYLNLHIHFSSSTLKVLTYPPPAYLIQLLLVLFLSFVSYQFLEKRLLK